MLLLTFIALQAAQSPNELTGERTPSAERCPSKSPSADDIVVCGRRDGQSPYRIGPQPPLPPALPDAQFKISEGVTAKFRAESGEVGGFTTNRAMFSVKVRF